jgi:methylmalonyl-CoA mutase cobalamin-binding subunit
MSNIKVLICSSVEGRFKLLFEKVSEILEKKGNFNLLLCVGPFFPVEIPEESLDKEIKEYIDNKKNCFFLFCFIFIFYKSPNSNLFSCIP